jgi:hypothetical protein
VNDCIAKLPGVRTQADPLKAVWCVRLSRYFDDTFTQGRVLVICANAEIHDMLAICADCGLRNFMAAQGLTSEQVELLVHAYQDYVFFGMHALLSSSVAPTSHLGVPKLSAPAGYDLLCDAPWGKALYKHGRLEIPRVVETQLEYVNGCYVLAGFHVRRRWYKHAVSPGLTVSFWPNGPHAGWYVLQDWVVPTSYLYNSDSNATDPVECQQGAWNVKVACLHHDLANFSVDGPGPGERWKPELLMDHLDLFKNNLTLLLEYFDKLSHHLTTVSEASSDGALFSEFLQLVAKCRDWQCKLCHQDFKLIWDLKLLPFEASALQVVPETMTKLFTQNAFICCPEDIFLTHRSVGLCFGRQRDTATGERIMLQRLVSHV